ncbi:histidine kinase [Actinocorallia libanotica]|uniref:histidine kinase n=1 Tax=Actinocorallia libanotica TaxID=46162 RepID=A0ABP4B3X4_9ACTN
MSASPPLPLLKRLPPGLWTALVWVTMAVWPIVEFVIMPRRPGYSLSYPRDGLDSPTAWVPLLLSFVLVLAGCALLHRRTAVAYGLVVVGTIVSTAAWRQDEIPPLQFLGVDVALCYVATVLPRRSSLTAAAGTLGMLGGYLVLRSVTGDDSGTAAEPFLALTVVIAWLIGNSMAQSRAHTEELHARAAAQAVVAERLRIAREMHDTVAHSIGVIALQAGAAARVVETQPVRAREAMIEVEKAGRETLAGLRRMLGTLRQADRQHTAPAEGSTPVPLNPAGLADVERLAATTTAAGVRVDVCWLGSPRSLSCDVDLAAFRIIQESVTNTVRHSGADSCRVSVDYREDELAIEVRDRGRGGDTGTDTGYGLAGMRERVALLHGDFTAGPCPDGGFAVMARLPAPEAASTARETTPTKAAGASPARTGAEMAPARTEARAPEGTRAARVGAGTVPEGTKEALAGTGAALKGAGTAPEGSRAARLGTGTAPEGPREALAGTGTTPEEAREALVGTGTASEGASAVLAGTGEVPEGARAVRVGTGTVPERVEAARVEAEASERGTGVAGAAVDEEVGPR